MYPDYLQADVFLPDADEPAEASALTQATIAAIGIHLMQQFPNEANFDEPLIDLSISHGTRPSELRQYRRQDLDMMLAATVDKPGPIAGQVS